MKKLPRILLKISGEALMGTSYANYDYDLVDNICEDIKKVHDLGYKICVVIGGGNICRGTVVTKFGIERNAADHMGMLATLINSIVLQNKLEKKNIPTRVLSATPIPIMVEEYVQRKALRYLEKRQLIIFGSGTGNPFFTTDTGAVLRAIEMDCSLVLKGTKVDGVYSKDPKQDNTAVKYQELSYDKVIQDNIAIMDATAITLARANKMPIRVFNIAKKGEFFKVMNEQGNFTNIK